MTESPLAPPDLDGASILLEGSMNPAIFHPRWLLAHNLIRAGEAELAERDVTTSSLYTSFSAEWFALTVEPTRFDLLSTRAIASFRQMADLTLGIFGILSHTPVTAVTITRALQGALLGASWEGLADALAPREIWTDIAGDVEMQSLVVRGEQKGSSPSTLTITVEPSAVVTDGAYIVVSERFDVPLRPGDGALPAMAVLRESWDTSLARSNDTITRLRALPPAAPVVDA